MSTAPTAFVEEAMRWLPDSDGDPAMTDVRGSQGPIATDALTVPNTPYARPRVLLADDNSDMREYVRSRLTARWDVETAANGQDALRVATGRRPTW